jgi:pyruvate kinase
MQNMSNEQPCKTKIIATIGPSSSDVDTLVALMKAGATIFRLNLSHITKQKAKELVQLIRKSAKKIQIPATIIADLPGPKVRISHLEENVPVTDGEEITIVRTPINKDDISLNYPEILDDLSIGETLYIDDGQIRLKISSRDKNFINCTALNSGILKPNKGINFPLSKIQIVFPTENDIDWLSFLCQDDLCDYVAVSYVRGAGDIFRIRGIIKDYHVNIGIIAKIEKHEALKDIENIVQLSDGIMVARGDLGLEISIEEIPHIQKHVIRLCNKMGKPVITATQMLESMIKSATPTRAEAADIANAILDGTDAVMLSAESAVSSNPVWVVETMRKIVSRAEKAFDKENFDSIMVHTVQNNISDAIAFSAARTAGYINASCVVCLTSSGSTARRIAKYRPDASIIAVCDNEKTQNQCGLFWRTRAYFLPLNENVQEAMNITQEFLLNHHLVNPGDKIVVTMGMPLGYKGNTNLIQVITVKE